MHYSQKKVLIQDSSIVSSTVAGIKQLLNTRLWLKTWSSYRTSSACVVLLAIHTQENCLRILVRKRVKAACLGELTLNELVRYYSFKMHEFQGGEVAQVVECLPSQCKAPSSNSTTAQSNNSKECLTIFYIFFLVTSMFILIFLCNCQ
jgi:hypothetical protein